MSKVWQLSTFDFTVENYYAKTVYERYIPINYYKIAAVVPRNHVLVKSDW
jgi:hypothetical protein